MTVLLLWASLVLLVTGIILRFMMRGHRAEWGKTVKWYQVQFWFMPWKTVDYLTPTGLRLFTSSTACIFIGIVLFVVAERLPK